MARQVGRTGPFVFSVVIAMAVAGMVVVAAVTKHRSAAPPPTRPAAATTKSAPRVMWSSTQEPCVVDVDGDGEEDVVGLARYIDGDEMKLTAVSGVDGHFIWQTASLGTYSQVEASRVVAAGGVVVRIDPGALLDGWDPKSGTRRWQVKTSDVVKRLCTGDELVVQTKDERWLAIAPATGATHDATAPHHCLDALAGSDARSHRASVPGMNVDAVLGSSAPRVAIGGRSPGTEVPMAAGLDASGHVTWKLELPGTGVDPLSANLESGYFAIDDRDVAIAYSTSPARYVVLIERATGRRRVEVKAPRNSPLSGIALAHGAVVIATWDTLVAFDRTSGKQRFRIALASE